MFTTGGLASPKTAFPLGEDDVSGMFLDILKAFTTSWSSYIFHSSRFSPFLEFAATKNERNSPGSMPASKI